eukprot:3869670-Amphidinium_carterae.1
MRVCVEDTGAATLLSIGCSVAVCASCAGRTAGTPRSQRGGTLRRAHVGAILSDMGEVNRQRSVQSLRLAGIPHDAFPAQMVSALMQGFRAQLQRGLAHGMPRLRATN